MYYLPDWQIIDDKQSDTSGGDGIDMGDVSDEVLEGELRQAMEYVIDFREHKYQYQRNTNIDVFAGYCTVSKSKFDFGQPLYHTYDIEVGQSRIYFLKQCNILQIHLYWYYADIDIYVL